MRWFKFHTVTTRKHKIQTLRGDVHKFWCNVLCLYAETERPLTLEKIAGELHSEPKAIQLLIDALVTAKLLDVTADNSYTPHDWDYWQGRRDRSTERVRAFRKRKKRDDENETLMKRSGNGSETRFKMEEKTNKKEGGRGEVYLSSSTYIDNSHKTLEFSTNENYVNLDKTDYARAQTNLDLDSLDVPDEKRKLELFNGCRELWKAGGKPFNFSDEANGKSLFFSRPLNVCENIARYAAWAFGEGGLWTTPRMTRRFVHCVENGDGDNGVPVRKLPVVAPTSNAASKKAATDAALQAWVDAKKKAREGA